MSDHFEVSQTLSKYVRGVDSRNGAVIGEIKGSDGVAMAIHHNKQKTTSLGRG